MIRLRKETIRFFTDKEEEILDVLKNIGMKYPVARLLVFLSRAPGATTLEIEHGADLRQGQVSEAVQYSTARGWILIRKIQSLHGGRRANSIRLAVPFSTIVASIGKARKKGSGDRPGRGRKVREAVQGAAG